MSASEPAMVEIYDVLLKSGSEPPIVSVWAVSSTEVHECGEGQRVARLQGVSRVV